MLFSTPLSHKRVCVCVQLVLVLLVAYAIVVMSALTLAMMFSVRRAAKSRLRLFSIFIALPRPTVMALASQSITVSGTHSLAWLNCCRLPCLCKV